MCKCGIFMVVWFYVLFSSMLSSNQPIRLCHLFSSYFSSPCFTLTFSKRSSLKRLSTWSREFSQTMHYRSVSEDYIYLYLIFLLKFLCFHTKYKIHTHIFIHVHILTPASKSAKNFHLLYIYIRQIIIYV